MSFDITRFDQRTDPVAGVGVDVRGSRKAADAIAEAGLSWEVALQDLYLPGDSAPLPDRKAVVRTDLPGVAGYLGTVGNAYRPVQNQRAFEFLDGVVGEALDYRAAGTLDKGRKVFLQAYSPRTISLGGGDDVDLFVMLWNAHDGTSQLRAGTTPIRIICKNTLMMALERIAREVTIRHAQKVDERLAQAENILALVDRYAEGFAQLAKHLRKQPISDAQVLQLAQLVYPRVASQEGDPEAWEGVQAAMAHETNGLKNMVGTKWAAYNAVALYADWGVRTRQRGDLALANQRRLQSTLMGDSKTAKDRALKLLQLNELPTPRHLLKKAA